MKTDGTWTNVKQTPLPIPAIKYILDSTNGGWASGFSLGSTAAYASGYSNNGAIVYNGSYLTVNHSPSGPQSWGSFINGSLNLSPFNKLCFRVSSATGTVYSVDVSTINQTCYFALCSSRYYGYGEEYVRLIIKSSAGGSYCNTNQIKELAPQLYGTTIYQIWAE